VSGGTALPDVLARIVDRRRAAYGVPAGRAETPHGGGRTAPFGTGENRFLDALRAGAPRAVIAEVKLGSPRLGSIADRVDPERQAALYASSGASALSVVVEPELFGGSWELLARCARASGLPAIAKEFVVHPRQLDEAKESGADAILLIAALYQADELRAWAGAARERGLVPLIETHDAADVDRLADADWELVGVNNRDLRTFEVDLAHSESLAPRLPAGAVRVAESGLAARADLGRLVAAGFEAFLIGESLLLAEDPAAKLRELVG